jgi:hypothetical protein
MQMQCLACGAEMRLNRIADDNTLPVAGFEHRTFECAACGDIERRLVFVGQFEPGSPDAGALHTTTAISPENEAPAAPAFGKRRYTKLYRVWRELARRQRSWARGADALKTPPSARPGAPMPEPPVEQVPELAPALPHLIEPLTPPTAAPVSIAPQADNALDECEVLLRRAIEIVHAETPPSQTTANLTELGSATPAASSTPAPVESKASPTAPKSALIAVQIHHDRERGKFVARDTKSGLSILRHQDGAWLRAMCDRMGWQIVDGAGAEAGE